MQKEKMTSWKKIPRFIHVTVPSSDAETAFSFSSKKAKQMLK